LSPFTRDLDIAPRIAVRVLGVNVEPAVDDVAAVDVACRNARRSSVSTAAKGAVVTQVIPDSRDGDEHTIVDRLLPRAVTVGARQEHGDG
jgi:hypothetical protein